MENMSIILCLFISAILRKRNGFYLFFFKVFLIYLRTLEFIKIIFKRNIILCGEKFIQLLH
mgnify:CR=1 FL=1|jgi:hypothetical protein